MAEHVRFDVGYVVRVPDALSLTDAAALPLAGVTGRPGLEIQPSEPPMPGDGQGLPASLRVAEVFGELARLEEIVQYCCRDVRATAELYCRLRETLLPLFDRPRY